LNFMVFKGHLEVHEVIFCCSVKPMPNRWS